MTPKLPKIDHLYCIAVMIILLLLLRDCVSNGMSFKRKINSDWLKRTRTYGVGRKTVKYLQWMKTVERRSNLKGKRCKINFPENVIAKCKTLFRYEANRHESSHTTAEIFDYDLFVFQLFHGLSGTAFFVLSYGNSIPALDINLRIIRFTVIILSK